MLDLKSILTSCFTGTVPAIAQDLTDLERNLDVVLPSDYKELLLWSNGCFGTVGSARYVFWNTKDINPRNESARIFHYLSKKFIGIGSNGEGKFYGLDYTNGNYPPVFVIVPMGDLDPESKFIVGNSITEALIKSHRNEFNDRTYDDRDDVIPSQEILNIKISNMRYAAEKYWVAKQYREYLDAISPLSENIGEIDKKRIALARKFLKII
jgi:hypothetical protein